MNKKTQSSIHMKTICLALLLCSHRVFSFQHPAIHQSNLFSHRPLDSVSSSPDTTRLNRNQKNAWRGKSSTKLNSAVLTGVTAAADTFFKTQPYAAAAIVCGFKASAADFIAQKRQYKKREASGEKIEMEISLNDDGTLAFKDPKKTDMRRNFAYILYGSVYQGMTQEFIYNHVYPMLFGAGIDLVTVLSKVAFDMLVQTVFVTLPIAYFSKALIYKYSFGEAIRRYVDDIKNHKLLIKYYALWMPVMSLAFSVVPEHFRVTFIAAISFFWLIILSSIANKAPIIQDEQCSLVDGETCNIDG